MVSLRRNQPQGFVEPGVIYRKFQVHRGCAFELQNHSTPTSAITWKPSRNVRRAEAQLLGAAAEI
jgi:hypothetical protein